MTTPANIPPAEWRILKVLWRGDTPLTVAEVVEALGEDTAWHPKTVRTLLGRLVGRGVVRKTKRPRGYQFSPTVDEKTCVRQESRSFLRRCFEGSRRSMLAHFIEHEDLSADEIEVLRKMLNKKARESKP